MMVIYPISQNCNDHGKLLTSMSTDAKITYEILTDEFGTHTYLCVSVCVCTHILASTVNLMHPGYLRNLNLDITLIRLACGPALGAFFLIVN